MAPFRVLIAGAGIAGLTLAQGLRRDGVECAVFERESSETWRTGYLLNLDAEGDWGLQRCSLTACMSCSCGRQARRSASTTTPRWLLRTEICCLR